MEPPQEIQCATVPVTVHLAERREEKERRREKILDAAESASTVGWDEFAMGQVARKARLSRALLNVYLAEKPDLMFSVE